MQRQYQFEGCYESRQKLVVAVVVRTGNIPRFENMVIDREDIDESSLLHILSWASKALEHLKQPPWHDDMQGELVF